MRLGTQHSGDLLGCRAAFEDHHQIEEGIGEGKLAWLRLLERDPPLGIEADPGPRRSHAVGGRIHAADARRRKLAGEEQHRLAVAKAGDERPLRGGNVKHGGGEPGQRGIGHGGDDRTPAGARPIL